MRLFAVWFSGGSTLKQILSSNTLSFWFLGAREFGLLRAQTILSREARDLFAFCILGAQGTPLCFGAEGFFSSFMAANTKDLRFHLSLDKTVEELGWDTWFLDGFGSIIQLVPLTSC